MANARKAPTPIVQVANIIPVSGAELDAIERFLRDEVRELLKCQGQRRAGNETARQADRELAE